MDLPDIASDIFAVHIMFACIMVLRHKQFHHNSHKNNIFNSFIDICRHDKLNILPLQ